MPVIRKLMLPVSLLLLAYAFWLSSDFKQIAAGVAILTLTEDNVPVAYGMFALGATCLGYPFGGDQR